MKIDPEKGITHVIELRWCRTGPILLSPAASEIMSVRTIMINSWRFMLVVMKDSELKAGDGDLVRSMLQGAVVRPDSRPFKVPLAPLNTEGLLKHYRDKDHLYQAATHRIRTDRP